MDHGLVEEVLRGLKVGVENGDVLKALVRDARHAVDHGAGLEALAVVAAHELDVVALLQGGDHRGVDLLAHRLAGGVVADLGAGVGGRGACACVGPGSGAAVWGR